MNKRKKVKNKSCTDEDFDVYSTYDEHSVEFNTKDDELDVISNLIYQRSHKNEQFNERQYYD